MPELRRDARFWVIERKPDFGERLPIVPREHPVADPLALTIEGRTVKPFVIARSAEGSRGDHAWSNFAGLNLLRVAHPFTSLTNSLLPALASKVARISFAFPLGSRCWFRRASLSVA